MSELISDPRLKRQELPRRLRLSAREIGVALALTFAAVSQLWVALSSKESRTIVTTEKNNRAAIVEKTLIQR